MLAAYLSPLAPAAVLLLGAFILSFVFPRLPARWQTRPEIQDFGASILVGLAVVALLGIRLTFGQDTSGEGLELLSGWNFSTAESAAALTIRADAFSLSFLILTFLILLSITLAVPTLASAAGRGVGPAVWLILAAGATLLFVSGNGLTIGYAVLLFDIFTAFYWLRRGHSDLSVARLFLGVCTTTGLVLGSLGGAPGLWLLALALWLRLGLYPFMEATIDAPWQDYGRLVYLALSLAVGFYLVLRGLAEPLPGAIRWLVVVTMLLNGLLAWLTGQRASLLTRLALAEASLILLAGPLVESIATAYTMGLILSLAALWVTPRLGKPRLSESAWPVPYLPAVVATWTLLGLPFSLGWPVRGAIYQTLFLANNIPISLLVILAEGLALSSLIRYWLLLWPGTEQADRRSVAGIVIMVPFLIPGLAPFFLTTITWTELPPLNFERSSAVLVAMVVTIAAGVGLGYFRPQIITRLQVSPAILAEWLRLCWLLPWVETLLNWAGKAILRISVFLEGQHYLGWALFMALVGSLIILLGT